MSSQHWISRTGAEGHNESTQLAQPATPRATCTEPAGPQVGKAGSRSLALTLTFDGHRVRMVGTPEAPMWVAKDVCRLLHIHNSGQALYNCVPDAERGLTICDTPGGPQQMATVTEPGLYRLILRSRKPAAERFRTWMVREVLPSIRRHGCFPPPPERPALPSVDLDDPAALRGLVEVLAVRRLADAEKIAELQPKAAMLDAIAESSGEVSLQDVGRHLGRPPNKTIWEMEEDGILFRGTHGTLTPHAQWIEAGYFRFVVTKPGGDGRTFGQTKVTKRGLVWLAGRYPAEPVPVVALERRAPEARA